ncbi:MAG: bacillithiol biosynthesis deacetylase BshB1 [Bacteroidia bacterium]|nr:bacillithiol biosynthesis deacetylase BshB1 [Bacteroidia bacterium]
MKLDLLVFAAHPDDAELGCSGTILKLVAAGKKVGIVDLTKGELGSRGTPELRMEEALAAGNIMGLSARNNLGFRDGFFTHDEAHLMAVVQMVRKYRPDTIFANVPEDRHPDHGRGSKLVRDAVFLSGLRKIETKLDGEEQEAWRPKNLFYYIQDYYHKPDFVVDITPYWEQKKDAIKAFGSQFFNPDQNQDEPQTYISSQGFWDFLEGRARDVGHLVGYELGEGFLCETPIGVEDPLELRMGW